MPDWIMTLLESDFVTLLLALALSVPIALNRERKTRIMGLRTFPLVAVASCGYLLVARSFIPAGNDGSADARILQGLIAGIGFIGGGAILKQDDRVLGTATAASIWMTGAIGAAAAYGRIDIGLFLSLANFAILRWLTPEKPDDEVDAESDSSSATTDEG